MEKMKDVLIKYKWIVATGLGATVVAVVAGVVMANIHIVNLVSYKWQGDVVGIVSLLESDIKNVSRQDDWYFKIGTEFLAEEMSEEARAFFETHFRELIFERQQEILQKYNDKNLLFANNNEIIDILVEHLEDESFASYVKRMSPEELDTGLGIYLGNAPEVNERLIKIVTQIATIYPKELPFDQFQFDVYDVLAMDIDSAHKEMILRKLNAEKASEVLFKALKTKPIDGDELKALMDFLNKTRTVDSKLYTSFNTIFSEIYLIRNQYSTIDEREVDLKNKKQKIELQLEVPLQGIEQKNKAVVEVDAKIADLEAELNVLSDYAYMALYIEKPDGNGYYEASIPKKGLFGNYKPSSQKYIIKLNTTDFYSEGVYYVDIYLKGTKTNSKGNEYPYYEEVAGEQKAQIEELYTARQSQINSREALKNEVSNLEAEIKRIKEETGYEQNEKALKDLATEGELHLKKLEEKAVEIKNLLGIGGVTVKLETEQVSNEQDI